jgi:preprotein translocase subunit SecF
MEILRDPKFDFMKYRKIWIGVSFATILAGIVPASSSSTGSTSGSTSRAARS